jgi:hypothetical protein
MTKLSLLLLLTLASAIYAAGQTATIGTDDLKILEGPKWTGTLTYLDYRSNKKTSIKSNVTVSQAKDQSGVWTFDYEYPDEPKANGASNMSLTDGGKMFNGQKVIERSVIADATSLRIVTTKNGTDNDKPAVFRFTYSVTPTSFRIKKEVQLDGSAEWFERNEYIWTR